MGNYICAYCGKPFERERKSLRVYCDDVCRKKMSDLRVRRRREALEKAPNQDLLEMANKACQLGLSYGGYMQKQYREKHSDYI